MTNTRENSDSDEKAKGKGIDLSDSQERANEDKGKGIGVGDLQEKVKPDKGTGVDIGDLQEKAKEDKGMGIDIGDYHRKSKGSMNARILMPKTSGKDATLPSSSVSTAKRTIWKCRMCSVSVTSEARWKDHIGRRRHKKLSKKLCRGKMDARLGNLFSCKLCGIRCDTETSLLEHYGGSMHHKNEAQKIGNAGGDGKKGDKGKGIDIGVSQEKANGDKGKGINVGVSQEKPKGEKGMGIDIGDSQGQEKGRANASSANASSAEGKPKLLLKEFGHPEMGLKEKLIPTEMVMQQNSEEHNIEGDTQEGPVSKSSDAEETQRKSGERTIPVVSESEVHKAKVATHGDIAESGSKAHTD